MARIERSDVRAVIDTDAPDSVIDGFIGDAELEVNERVKTANVGYSEDRMKKLEKYLSAHFVRFLYDRQEQRSSVADIRTDYSGAFGDGLSATSAGQVVLDTDTADVFPSGVTDDGSAGGSPFVKRDRFTATASPAGSDRVEGTEKEGEIDPDGSLE